jgi:hypothetical protein
MTFRSCFHLHQHQSSCKKNQSTQHCQSLVTPGSNHPPVLEPHMALNLPLDECIDNTRLIIKEKRKKKRNDQRNSNKRLKAKQRQRARSLERGKTRSP